MATRDRRGDQGDGGRHEASATATAVGRADPPRAASGSRHPPPGRRHPAQRRRRGGAGRPRSEPAPPLARPPRPDRRRLPHAVPGPQAPDHQLAPDPGPDHPRHVDLAGDARHQDPRPARPPVPRRPRPAPHSLRARGHRADRGELLSQRGVRLRHLRAGPAAIRPAFTEGQPAPEHHPRLGRVHRRSRSRSRRSSRHVGATGRSSSARASSSAS